MLRLSFFALVLGILASTTQPHDLTMGVAAADSLGRFPRVEGRNLEDAHFDLPMDFAGMLNVVLVAFKREQQADVDSWMPFLKTIATARSDVRIYELPTLGKRYRVIRSVIDGGMRRGIPDVAVRAATVTLYVDKAGFRRALNLADEERIYVLLVDRKGLVHWRAAGPFDPASGAELQRQLMRAAADTTL